MSVLLEILVVAANVAFNRDENSAAESKFCSSVLFTSFDFPFSLQPLQVYVQIIDNVAFSCYKRRIIDADICYDFFFALFFELHLVVTTSCVKTAASMDGGS